MNINASIIDQNLGSVTDIIRQQALEELRINDEGRLKSLAFVYLCVKTVLDLEDVNTFDCLTEGGGDFGVDAMHISEEYDGEFTVSLFQAKYKNNLEGNANFPEEGVESLINAIKYLFDPTAKLEHINQRLLVKVEEARSLIRDGYIPQVRALACNNGLNWNVAAQEAIDRTEFGDQVTWEHINHERLVKILQASKPVKDTLQLSGKAIVEDMEFSRVLVGRISVTEIATLIERHGERLLERNIRRYLGLQGNRVNEGIRHTLMSEEKNNFYFYNNGVTLICESFSYNALQNGDYQVRIENLQIINGGQTCMTISKTLQEPNLLHQNAQAYVLLRLYQLPSDNDDLVQKITYATNSQNPVDLKDLRANDFRQQRLEMDIKQLG
jgi:AIPR protein